jgi:hypothetical protein
MTRLRFVVRVGRLERYTYLLAASLARAGVQTLVSMADAHPPRKSNEALYFEFLRSEPNVVFMDRLESAGGDVLLDFVGNAPPPRAWSAVIRVVAARRATPVAFDGPYERYLVTGDHVVNDDEARSRGLRLAHCPFWPHPRVFRSHAPVREATRGPRPVGAVFAATMQPPERIVLANQLRDRLGADGWLRSSGDAAGDAQRIIRHQPRCVLGFGRVCTFESWMELLGATRWCIDAAGYEYVTHRVIEACMSGCAIILDERSAATYDPPFRNGIDCRTYDTSTFADVVLDALATTETARMRLAVAAQDRLPLRAGPEAVLRTVLQLIEV